MAQDLTKRPIRSLEGIKRLICIRIERYGNDTFVLCQKQPDDKDIAAAQHALKQARKAMLSAKYDIILNYWLTDSKTS